MHSAVSIMLATFNRLPLTKRMLASLFENTHTPYRLIIVDNGSTDGTSEWLKALVPPNGCQSLDILFNEENRGIAIARNQALKIADKYESQWYTTIDNDVDVPKNSIAECIDIIQSNPNFIIGVNMEGTPYPLITLNGKTFQIKPAGNAGTAFMVFNRSLHEKVGFFFTDFPEKRYAHEDADMGFRARLAGFQIGYLKEMGNHFGGEKENDSGEYREMKNKCSKENLATFRKNCALYASKQKPLYIPFDEDI